MGKKSRSRSREKSRHKEHKHKDKERRSSPEKDRRERDRSERDRSERPERLDRESRYERPREDRFARPDSMARTFEPKSGFSGYEQKIKSLMSRDSGFGGSKWAEPPEDLKIRDENGEILEDFIRSTQNPNNSQKIIKSELSKKFNESLHSAKLEQPRIDQSRFGLTQPTLSRATAIRVRQTPMKPTLTAYLLSRQSVRTTRQSTSARFTFRRTRTSTTPALSSAPKERIRSASKKRLVARSWCVVKARRRRDSLRRRMTTMSFTCW